MSTNFQYLKPDTRIPVAKKTRDRLGKFQDKLRHRTYGDSIEYLLDYYEKNEK